MILFVINLYSLLASVSMNIGWWIQKGLLCLVDDSVWLISALCAPFITLSLLSGQWAGHPAYTNSPLLSQRFFWATRPDLKLLSKRKPVERKLKQRIMWQNDMLPTDSTSVGAYRWCSHLSNAFEAVLAMASLPFRLLLVSVLTSGFDLSMGYYINAL